MTYLATVDFAISAVKPDRINLGCTKLLTIPGSIPGPEGEI